MSNGVTDYTGKREQPPPPQHAGWLWWALAFAALILALSAGFGLARYDDERTPPATPIVVTKTVQETVIVTREVDHWYTVPPATVEVRIDQTVPVTRIVYQVVTATPVPSPAVGKG